MIRKYVLPLLAIIGFGVAVIMVIKGNRTRPVTQPVVQAAKAPFTSSIRSARRPTSSPGRTIFGWRCSRTTCSIALCTS